MLCINIARQGKLMKRKCLAIVIILLFFGTSTIPVIAQNIKKNSLVIVNNNWLDFSCNELKKFFNENNEFTKFKKRFFPISIRNKERKRGVKTPKGRYRLMTLPDRFLNVYGPHFQAL